VVYCAGWQNAILAVDGLCRCAFVCPASEKHSDRRNIMTATAAFSPQNKEKAKKTSKNQKLSREDMMILSTLEMLKKDLDRIHLALDAVTDPDLIDSFVYELSAINKRYTFYLQMCKQRGLVSAMF